MVSTAVRGTIALLVAGAASAILGAGSASAASVTPADQSAPAGVSVAQPYWWVDCDDWRNRWNQACYQNTRWYWHGDNYGHGRWDHWQNDGRGHWNDRGGDDRGHRR